MSTPTTAPTPTVHQLVWYITSKGERCRGIITAVGTDSSAGVAETIWFDHPDGTPGKMKYVHRVPRQVRPTDRRCWVERTEPVDNL